MTTTPSIASQKPILQFINVSKFFRFQGQQNSILPLVKKFLNKSAECIDEEKGTWALKNFSFELYKGECLAIVGESGSGKSTLARLLVGLGDATSGDILFHGKKLNEYSNTEKAKKIQMVFQDAYGSINPRKNVLQIVSEPLKIHNTTKNEILNKVQGALRDVELPLEFLSRYPHELSGGQRQRVGLARAIVNEPDILILDEPVSALDVSVQAQILNLLKKLQKEKNLTCLFISHDLSVVRFISNRIIVLYKGEMIEEGNTEDILKTPLQSYTKNLIESIPHL